MKDENIVFTDLKRNSLDYPWGKLPEHKLYAHPGSGSGGYAHNVLVHAAKELFGIQLNDLQWKTVRYQHLLIILFFSFGFFFDKGLVNYNLPFIFFIT